MGPLGLVVNPVAGLGGAAGLKGSDGVAVQQLARSRGGQARATERAVAALARVAAVHPGAEVLTAAGEMGADAVSAAGLVPVVVFKPTAAAVTTGADTTLACRALVESGAGLTLFVGGDGTARDVAGGAAGHPVLGVPSGVKMYSSCFAVSPVAAGALAAAWLSGRVASLEEREVLDVDEDQVRTGSVHPRLHALVRVPAEVGRTQARKAATAASERAAVERAASGAVARMQPDVAYLLGPGGTVAAVARQLGVEGTPLGVDVVRDGELLVKDACAADLLDVVRAGPSRAVVTVVGGQGFLLGRGNQQLSAPVLSAIGSDPLLVVATEAKLIALQGRPLLVDTGDRAVDRRLAGHVRVVTGRTTSSIYPVLAPEAEGDQA